MAKQNLNLELLSPPGDTIAEQLEFWDTKKNPYTVSAFMDEMGINRWQFDLLMHGKLQITEDIAKKLETIFQIDKGFWMKRQENYEIKLAKIFCTTDEEVSGFRKGLYLFVNDYRPKT